jgi:hypothetical protein
MAAETTQELTQDGQEVQQQDFNNVASEAAHAEDYVFAEMLRLAPYNGTSVAKAVIPPGPFWNGAAGALGLVSAAAGGVNLAPFRAIAGPRTAISAYSPPSGAPALVAGQNNPPTRSRTSAASGRRSTSPPTTTPRSAISSPSPRTRAATLGSTSSTPR